MRRHLKFSTAWRAQRGAVAVEFAIVATVFFMVLFGALEFARMLWTWNAAAEAARYGARLAVVCDLNEANIKVKMRTRLATLTNANIALSYLPGGCTATTCQTATVTLSGYVFTSLIPFIAIAPTLPAFTTTLSRESMSSTSNPVCT